MVKFLFSRRSKKRLFIEIVLVVILISSFSLFMYLRLAQAAVITWDGGGTTGTCGVGNENNWSCGENWSGDVAPGTSDIATFDGTHTKPAWIDSAIDVAGIDINSGYTGTIVASASATVGASSFDQAAGTWDGADQTLIIDTNGNFTVSGGTHNATTGTWSLERNFTHSGGALNMSNATVTLTDDHYQDHTVISCSGEIDGEFASQKDNSSSSFEPDIEIGSGCEVTFISSFDTGSSITVEGTLNATNITTDSDFTLNGTLNLSGTILFDDNFWQDSSTLTCSGTFPGTVDTLKDDVVSSSVGDFTLSSGCEITLVSTVDTQGSIVNNGTMNGTNIFLEKNFTQGVGATTNISGKITFDDNHFLDQSTISCTGIFAPTVDILKDDMLAGSGATFTLNSGCEITLDTDVYVEGTFTNNGTINATNIITDQSFVQDGTLNMDGVLTLSGGSSNGALDCNGGTLSTGIVDVVINKTSSALLSLSSDCDISGDLTRTDGLLNASGAYTLSIGGDLSISTSDAFGEADFTIEMNGTGTQNITQNAGTFSSPLVIDKTSGSVVLLTALTINATGSDMTITDGEFQNSTFALTVTDVLTVNDTFTQGSGHVTIGTLTVGANGSYSNPSTGNLIVGAGGVGNSGDITIGVSSSCPTTDGRAITSSSPGNQRSWSGSGSFAVFDTLVTDQGGSAVVNAFSSTSVSNNDGNWTFYDEECELPINPVLRGGSTFRGGTVLQ